ncbi:MAG: hypothetical protein ACYC28_05975, partial [Longimicrobiales bacterium]
PDSTYNRLQARAASAGLTISAYILTLLQREVGMPEPQDLRARIRELSRVSPSESAADAVRAEREGRSQEVI